MNKFFSLLLAAIVVSFCPNANASLSFYTGVSAFTNALQTYKRDSLDGIQLGMIGTGVTRPDFTIFAPSSIYGCNSHGGSSNSCGNNSLIGFDDAFLICVMISVNVVL
jgi:hypothetical protein